MRCAAKRATLHYTQSRDARLGCLRLHTRIGVPRTIVKEIQGPQSGGGGGDGYITPAVSRSQEWGGIQKGPAGLRLTKRCGIKAAT